MYDEQCSKILMEFQNFKKVYCSAQFNPELSSVAG
jgi:hypothetical protein